MAYHSIRSSPDRFRQFSALPPMRVLESLTPPSSTRIIHAENAFAELVLWRLGAPMAGSAHRFKYRLAYVVERECVLRFDNEAEKGDHRHYGNTERPYRFTTTEQLLADFDSAIARWNHENRDP